eukprot:CAMPEP_0170178982 /NCGR_PEP_ID=MMETSP0040_2-20121228/15759_1 /TAXON_ID=641309 /ORGANISM="Lotharella oceanica, Strain CCMP622" /LENGTH=36 /DNA_ID= /DNA_START= /DNA_END= /DNA_ORIENTATION=
MCRTSSRRGSLALKVPFGTMALSDIPDIILLIKGLM